MARTNLQYPYKILGCAQVKVVKTGLISFFAPSIQRQRERVCEGYLHENPLLLMQVVEREAITLAKTEFKNSFSNLHFFFLFWLLNFILYFRIHLYSCNFRMSIICEEY